MNKESKTSDTIRGFILIVGLVFFVFVAYCFLSSLLRSFSLEIGVITFVAFGGWAGYEEGHKRGYEKGKHEILANWSAAEKRKIENESSQTAKTPEENGKMT